MITHHKSEFANSILCKGYYICNADDPLDRNLYWYVRDIGSHVHVYLALKYYNEIKDFISKINHIPL